MSTNVDFTDLLIEKTAADALPSTAWQSDVDLDYETTYYWKVRGLSKDSYSSWSAVSAFTTEPLPEPPSPELETNPETPEPETTEPLPEAEPETALEPIEQEITPKQPSTSPTQSVEITLPSWATFVFIAILSVIALLLIVILGLVILIRRL